MACTNTTTKESIASLTNSIRSSSRPMAAAAEAMKSEYEHWEEPVEGAPAGGCQPGCSDGTETATACGEVVTEVFDLINEVAFSEVIDLAKQEEKEETKEREDKLGSDGDSTIYREDDDSMFNRTDEYHKTKDAMEFLGFIGAVKTDTKPIIPTPIAPPSLLAPDGIPSYLPLSKASLLEILSKEEEVEEPEPEPERQDDSCQQEENKLHGDDDDIHAGATNLGSKRSIYSNSSDHFSGVDENLNTTIISEKSSNGDEIDWCDEDSEEKADGKYKTYIENIVSKNKRGSRIKHAIANQFKHGFKRTRNKYSKVSLASEEEKSELLTIVESSDEDAHQEDSKIQEKEAGKHVQRPKEYQHADNERTESKTQDEVKEKNRANDAHDDESYCSNASECSYSVYNETEDLDDGDDRTYVSLSVSEDESFLELEDASVTYSIGVKDSTLEESLTHHSNSYEEEDSYESVSRHTLSVGSSEDNRSLAEEHQPSVAEETLREEEVKKNEPPQLCSVYDNLYPTDSLFSFATKDETESLFDFSNSGLRSENESLEPPTSVILQKSSIKEIDCIEPPNSDAQLNFSKEDIEERDQLQDERCEVEKEGEDKVLDIERHLDAGKKVTEERDGVEEKKNIENDQSTETDERRDGGQISEVESMFVSTDATKTSADVDSEIAQDKAETFHSREIKSIQGTAMEKEEAASSGKSSSTNRGTEFAKNADKIESKRCDRGHTRFRRQVPSRVRMFHQHRHNIGKMQYEAE